SPTFSNEFILANGRRADIAIPHCFEPQHASSAAIALVSGIALRRCRPGALDVAGLPMLEGDATEKPQTAHPPVGENAQASVGAGAKHQQFTLKLVPRVGVEFGAGQADDPLGSVRVER